MSLIIHKERKRCFPYKVRKFVLEFKFSFSHYMSKFTQFKFCSSNSIAIIWNSNTLYYFLWTTASFFLAVSYKVSKWNFFLSYKVSIFAKQKLVLECQSVQWLCLKISQLHLYIIVLQFNLLFILGWTGNRSDCELHQGVCRAWYTPCHNGMFLLPYYISLCMLHVRNAYYTREE